MPILRGFLAAERDDCYRFATICLRESGKVRRIALTLEQARGLPSFPAADKVKDTRYRWFVSNYGNTCWELDAMDPRVLRECVERAIKEMIEPEAWAKCEQMNRAEEGSLRFVMERWRNPMWDDPVV